MQALRGAHSSHHHPRLTIRFQERRTFPDRKRRSQRPKRVRLIRTRLLQGKVPPNLVCAQIRGWTTALSPPSYHLNLQSLERQSTRRHPISSRQYLTHQRWISHRLTAPAALLLVRRNVQSTNITKNLPHRPHRPRPLQPRRDQRIHSLGSLSFLDGTFSTRKATMMARQMMSLSRASSCMGRSERGDEALSDPARLKKSKINEMYYHQHRPPAMDHTILFDEHLRPRPRPHARHHS